MSRLIDELAAHGFNSTLGRLLSKLLLAAHPRTVGIVGGDLIVECDDRRVVVPCAELERAATPEAVEALLKKAAAAPPKKDARCKPQPRSRKR